MRSGAIIYPILRTYGALTDLVSPAKFFAVRAKQATTSPYLVYREISTIPLNTKGDSTDNTADPRIQQRSILDISRVQISVFANDYLEVENIAVVVREALDREWGTVESPYENDIYTDSIVFESSVDDYDDDAENRGVYVKHLDFTIRVNRINLNPSSMLNIYSLAFDGVDDILITTKDSSIMPTDNLTVGCWINPSTWAFAGSSQNYYPFGCVASGGWGIYFNNNYLVTETLFKAIIRVSDTGGGSEGYLEPSAGAGFSATLRALTGWHYISLTYDKATGVAKLYLDGVEKATETGQAEADIVYHGSNDRPLMFGADAATDTTGANFFEGNIDESSVWNKALTAAELLAVYNSGLPLDLTSNYGDYVSSANLQGWWRMGDPDGTSAYPTITDASTNTNNGTMTNMDAADINTDIPT
tara:strand:- start:5892 stop:7142 length:1251 start_codon:yes stop_codon:yes gene_type:complete